jgi:diguanylate cyclase (GGDEF)-like protein
MDHYAFLAAKATLLFLAAVLIAEYAIRRRKLERESEQNRKKQQQLAAYSTELKALKRDLARKTEVAEKLPQITKQMTERLPPDAYPAVVVRCVKEILHAEKVGYFAPVEGSPDYTLVVGTGFPPDWQGKARFNAGDGMLGLALHRKVVVSRADPNSPGRRSSLRTMEEMNVLPDFVAPVFGDTGIAGALVVAGCPSPLGPEKAYISMLADQMSVMLQNAALLASSRHGTWVDYLTGVSNRLYFLQRFESEIRRTENYRQSLALFMFDIDEFKKVNDTHGHHAGDVVIRKLAEVVRKNTRGSDLVARFGGDEFVLLITSTTEEQAVLFAEKMREMIAATDIAIPGTQVPVRITISGGLAMFPVHGQSTTELSRAADHALYESKRQGKNRVRVAPSIGLDGRIAEEPDADREAGKPEKNPDSPGADVLDYALGELGGKPGG